MTEAESQRVALQEKLTRWGGREGASGRQAGGEQPEGWGRVPTHSGFKTGSPVLGNPLGLGQSGKVGLLGEGES